MTGANLRGAAILSLRAENLHIPIPRHDYSAALELRYDPSGKRGTLRNERQWQQKQLRILIGGSVRNRTRLAPFRERLLPIFAKASTGQGGHEPSQ